MKFLNFKMRNFWAATILIFIAAGTTHSAEVVLPFTTGLYFQTNGPLTERNNGDWWTSVTGGDTLHYFEIVVPASVDPGFVLSVDVFDPESFKANGGLDEQDKRGGNEWDSTAFKVYPPTGNTPISEMEFAPNGGTTNTWVNLATFNIGTYGPGTYRVYSKTYVDDENYFRLRINENDPDGIPLSGDEIIFQAVRTSIQFPVGGSASLYMHVFPGEPVLNIFNFDMDTPVYAPQYIITDPLGNSYNGIVSGEDEWNTGSSALPTTGGDEFINPTPGWWRVDITLSIHNQIIIYGRPWVDFPPEERSIIGDLVWVDENQNGVQDTGEPGVVGVTVNLLDNLDNVLESTITDGNGFFMFIDYLPGNYRLEFELPMDHFFTAPNIGNDFYDSDADPLTGRTDLFPLTANDVQRQWDAGLIPKNVSDLAVEKEVDKEYAQPADTLLYNILVTNNGPDSAVNVEVIDDVPPGLIFIDAVPPQNSGPNPLVWIIAELDSGETVHISFRARATDQHLGGIDNNVFVSSENRDPDLSNNSAAAQTHILIPVELTSFTAKETASGILLEWVTQSESEVMGFNVYRSENYAGPYLQLNKSIIPAAGNSQTEQKYSYTDKSNREGNKEYYYKLADVSFEGEMTFHDPVSLSGEILFSYNLEQNYPNPFNIQTTIRFELRKGDIVNLSIYNMNGQLVRTLISGYRETGIHETTWDGKNSMGEIVPSGNYIYSLRAQNFEHVQKMVLVK
ncbi:DUF11 domain-containing protein [candidate division KSB1 bacterium]|nr:DUF11 domain-containing protein [candidate division KSB1 bacterium]